MIFGDRVYRLLEEIIEQINKFKYMVRIRNVRK